MWANGNPPNPAATICAHIEDHDHFCARGTNRLSAQRGLRDRTTTNYLGRRWLAGRNTAGAIQRQTSKAVCTLNTMSGSSKLCPHSSIA
jgi:hypothetical protein